MFPEPYNVLCPKCGSRLKQWPSRGPEFYCEGVGCTRVGGIDNNGSNRFNCFICDYDLCLQCVRRQVGE